MPSSIFQPIVPRFCGKNYDNWSFRVKLILCSQELLEIVENGYIEPDD